MQKTVQIQQAQAAKDSEKHQVTNELKPSLPTLSSTEEHGTLSRWLLQNCELCQNSLSCVLTVEGTRPTLAYTSPQGLKDTEYLHLHSRFPGPDNGKTLAAHKSLVHQLLNLHGILRKLTIQFSCS